MLDQILSAINEEKWQVARELLDQYLLLPNQVYTDVVGILEASICMTEDDYEAAWKATEHGLCCNMCNYELYFIQGQIMERQENYRAAYLCYLQSELYAEEGERDFVESVVDEFQKSHPAACRKIVLIASADDEMDKLQVCIESIFKCVNAMLCDVVFITCPDQVEAKKFLEQQNVQVVEMAAGDNYASVRNRIMQMYGQEDVFLLSADCALLPNAVHNMAMVMAERESIGLVVAGMCRGEQAVCYSYLAGTDEQRLYFTRTDGVLISRNGFSGQIQFDEKFALEKYVLMDMAMESLERNHENVKCNQGYVYRIQKENVNQMMKQNDKDYFKGKCGFNIEYYNNPRVDLIGMIKEERNEPIRVLEIGCGTGATLLQIKRKFPNAQVYGLELQEEVVKWGAKLLPIVCGNVEDRKLDYPDAFFDYIIMGDVLEHLVNPEDTLAYLKKFLKKKGYVLTSIPNIQHFTVILPLLFGEFEYVNSGVLDRTHLRFFTLKSILNMFERLEYVVEDIYPNALESFVGPWADEMLQKLCAISDNINYQDFITLQYRVKARKCE